MSNKAHRALAVARRKSYYGAQPARTTANKKRRLAKQIRHFPEDTMAVALFIEKYGDAAAQSHLANRTSRSEKRARRRSRPKKRPKPVIVE